MYVYILFEQVAIPDSSMPRLMDVYETLEDAINALPAPSGNTIKRGGSQWITEDNKYWIGKYEVKP